MGEEVPDWAQMWGAKVKMPTDMRDDMLRDAIDTCRDALDQCGDFEAEGQVWMIFFFQRRRGGGGRSNWLFPPTIKRRYCYKVRRYVFSIGWHHTIQSEYRFVDIGWYRVLLGDLGVCVLSLGHHQAPPSIVQCNCLFIYSVLAPVLFICFNFLSSLEPVECYNKVDKGRVECFTKCLHWDFVRGVLVPRYLTFSLVVLCLFHLWWSVLQTECAGAS